MSNERRVKLFRNGRNHAVRIPKEFELPGDEVFVRREGDQLILKPVQSMSLIEYLESLEPLDEEFAEIEDLPVDDIEI
jgi:antitoxin VapB